MRFQSVSIGDGVLSIAFQEVEDADHVTGVVEHRFIEVPMHMIGEELFADLADSVRAIVDDVRLQQRRPALEFDGPG